MRFATRAHIEAVFEENHGLWGGPLSPQQYRDYWFSLFLTPWGSSNFRYMALTEEEEGPLLSTLKLYRFTGSLYGKPIVIAGIGAVYTPEEQRTFGSASLLISEVLDYMQKKRAALALLYTDIGLPFYERLGFVPLPGHETTGPLDRVPRRASTDPPGVTIREIQVRDSALLAPLHKELAGGRPLSIDREASYWEFLLYKRRQFWDMAPPGTGIPLSFLALRGGRALASGFAVAGRDGLRVQELGALPGEEEALRAILDRIWDAGAEAGAERWHGRIPAEASRLDGRLAGERKPLETSIPMAAALGETPPLDSLAADPAFFLFPLDAI